MTASDSTHVLIGVMGSGASELPSEVIRFAYDVGSLVARMGFTLLTGGRGGIMHHASQGAQEAGGLVVGILPGRDKSDINPFVDIPLVTGINDARNLINILSSHVIIAFPGGGGTLSEIGMALKNSIPIIDCGNWHLENSLFKLDSELHSAGDISAVERLLEHFHR